MRWVKIAAILVACIFVMQYLHELGHALVSKALGYDVVMTINKVVSSGAEGAAPIEHSLLIAAGGPLVTICLAFAAYAVRQRLGILAPIIVFNALAMRVIAALVSLSNPNDEAWMSSALGLGMWTLPALVCALLASLYVGIAHKARFGWQWYGTMWAGIAVGYTSLVFGEQLFPRFVF